MDIFNRVCDLAKVVTHEPEAIYSMSTGERIAAALLNDRMDLLPPMYKHPLDAIDRLGDEWLAAVCQAHKAGWK